MKITTAFRDGDAGLTIEVDGTHRGHSIDEIAARVASAVAEVLTHAWIPPDPPDQP